jgi:hypothetical protein
MGTPAKGLLAFVSLSSSWSSNPSMKDNRGWSGGEEFRNLTPNDKANLQEQE